MLSISLRTRLTVTTLITASALVTGCASVSTLQTARTLPSGQVRAYMGGGTYGGSAYSKDAILSEAKVLAEGGIRVGIADNIDAGIRLTLPATAYFDGKYQLLDLGEFAVASGLGIGYTNVSSDDSSVALFDLVVPFYASYDFSRSFALYASPKYMLRLESGTNITSTRSGLIAGTVGLKLGDTWGAMLEGSYLKGIGSITDFSATQANGVLFWSTDALSFLKP